MVKIDFDRLGLDSAWGQAHKYKNGFLTDSVTMGGAEGADARATQNNVEQDREREDIQLMTDLMDKQLMMVFSEPSSPADDQVASENIELMTDLMDKQLMMVLSEPSAPADDQDAEQVTRGSDLPEPESEKRLVEQCSQGDDQGVEQASKRAKKDEFGTDQQAIEQKPTPISQPSCWSFFASMFTPQYSASAEAASLERPLLPEADPDLKRALDESASLTEAKELSLAVARVRLQDVMEKHQAKARPVEADGNCQFRALALQLHGDECHHAKVRSAMVERLKCMQEHYQDFVHEPFEDYMNRMACDGEWGDNVTLQAASDMLCRDIHILNDQPGAEHISVHPARKADSEAEKPLWLAFLAEMHYDAVEFF